MEEHARKNFLKGLIAAIVIAVLVTIGLIVFGEKKTPEQEAEEKTQQATEGIAQSAVQGTLPQAVTSPESNPAKKLPEVNPVQKINPYTGIKTNPF